METGNTPNARKETILIVDDEPNNLRFLETILTSNGYAVRVAISGAMAIKSATLDAPDVILLDITMPGINGFDVCERLKHQSHTADIPVLFVSALQDASDKVRAFAVGGADYITKPFQVEEVLARIRNQLIIRRLQLQLKEANASLEQRIANRTAELADVVERLINMNEAYECFVPRAILNLLNKDDITQARLGDQAQQEMTMMFADIRSFTTLSESMTPQQNFDFINSYLGHISPIIRQHHGFIDKFMGDAIMALFPNIPDDALNAAIDMQREVRAFNLLRQQQGCPPIQVGIGLHIGSVMLGIIGEEQRKQGTVISDSVNTAARLEDLNKIYGTSILISDRVLFVLSRPVRYSFRFLGKVSVKGKKKRVVVFDVLDGYTDEEKALKLQTQSDFEKGQLHFFNHEYTRSLAHFQKVLAVNPNDKAARYYAEQATSMIYQTETTSVLPGGSTPPRGLGNVPRC